jgi:phage major head subunit gpT-like protein
MPLGIDEINRIEKLVRKEFSGAFAQSPASYKSFTSEMESTETVEYYEWMGSLPKVKEWVGARKLEDLKKYDYSIKNKDWENTIRFPYPKAWDKSKTVISSLLKQRVGQLAEQYGKDYPAELIIQMIEAGHVNLAYDGYPFFSNLRTNQNMITGTGTTVDQIIADLKTARLRQRKFVDDRGRKLNIVGSLALIPPDLEVPFQEATRARLRNSSDNMMYGASDYIVDARLTDVNDWYLLAVNEFIKPVIFQSKQGISVNVKDETFDNKQIVIGADTSGNIGYSFPELAVKIVNA